MSTPDAATFWDQSDSAWPGGQPCGRRLVADSRPTDHQLTWYALRSATRREMDAEEGLVDAGFVVYLPRLIRWRRTSRIKVRIEAPLFGGYLFVGLSPAQDLADVMEIPGVHQVVKAIADADPVPVPFERQQHAPRSELMEAMSQLDDPEPLTLSEILRLEVAGEFDKTRRDRRKDPPPGTHVEIIAGRFKGFQADFVHRRDDERIEVMFTLFGRSNPLVLKPEEVGGLDHGDDE